MNALTQWLHMGGYAAYVWPAYGTAFLVIGGLTLISVTDYRRKKLRLSALQASRRKKVEGVGSTR